MLARTLTGHIGAVNAVAFSPDDKTLLAGGADHVLGLWDIASGRRIASMQGLMGVCGAVAWHPSLPVAASGMHA